MSLSCILVAITIKLLELSRASSSVVARRTHRYAELSWYHHSKARPAAPPFFETSATSDLSRHSPQDASFRELLARHRAYAGENVTGLVEGVSKK